jgi:3-deoxy-D-manno-octulosonate 8-phosphate phosphatase (KDO 8-P phosphatase)
MENADFSQRAVAVRLILLDVDGVLTDGRITYDSLGRESKSFHVRDGHRIKLAGRHGLTFGIITGRSSPVVDQRAAEIGISLVHQGAKEKLPVFEKIVAAAGLEPGQVAYMGDDIVDLPLLTRVGLAATVADAAREAIAHAHFVSRFAGGRGAVCELVELILKAQGKWDAIMRAYLSE